MSEWQEGKMIVAEAGRQLLGLGLIGGKAGNISLRLPDQQGRDLLAITPHGKEYGGLTPNDVQIIDFEGEPLEGDLAPSVETLLHVGVYRARKDIKAVVHTHSVFASVLSVAGLELLPIMDEQVVVVGESVRLAQYGLPGSQELVDNAVAALGDRNAVLLSNHGMVGVGRTMGNAVEACRIVETTAKIYLFARMMGKVNLLPKDALEVGKAFFTHLQSEG